MTINLLVHAFYKHAPNADINLLFLCETYLPQYECKNEDKKLHRNNGPAQLLKIGTQKWYQHGKLHRDDGPAIVYFDERHEWFRNGRLHRDDGPAIITSDGTKLWYQNCILHRDDGPAIITSDGTKLWYQNGKRHRDFGPALIRANEGENRNGTNMINYIEMMNQIMT